MGELAYRLAKQANVVIRLVDQVHLGLYNCMVEYVHKNLNREGYDYYEAEDGQNSRDDREILLLVLEVEPVVNLPKRHHLESILDLSSNITAS